VSRVALDRNVLVSAALTPDGPCAQLLDAARRGELEILISPHLMDDLTGALARRLPAEAVGRFVWRLRDASTLVEDPHWSWPAGSIDPSYVHVIAVARERGAGTVVSGNGRLLRDDLPGLRVVSPRSMLDQLHAARRRDSAPALETPGSAKPGVEMSTALDRARAARLSQPKRIVEPGMGIDGT
jgi:predicted nucleic acid-binding protein